MYKFVHGCGFFFLKTLASQGEQARIFTRPVKKKKKLRSGEKESQLAHGGKKHSPEQYE
jgi:hypothetical protein